MNNTKKKIKFKVMKKKLSMLFVLLIVVTTFTQAQSKKDIEAELATSTQATMDLSSGFASPPDAAKPRVYWWWLNNLVSEEGITRDLEQFKAKGIAGVLLFNAGGPAGPMPSGPDFMGLEWREMVKHAVREADRLGIEVSINLCSGWDAGGPWITDETASHHYVQSELVLQGPRKFAGPLPQPSGNVKGYHDVAVQAFRKPKGGKALEEPKGSEMQKTLAIKSARGSVKNQKSVSAGVEASLAPPPFDPQVAALDPAAIVNLSEKLKPDGTLVWNVPKGEWIIVRTGYTPTGRPVSVSTKGGNGPEMDWLNASAMDHHFKSMAEVLLNDSPDFVGKSLKYLHDDSWEVGLPNWTRGFLDEFKKYRGYDALPYLPVLSGYAVSDAQISDRFLHDFRKTIADCLADNHYGRFADLAHGRGLGVHPEGGGPCWPEVVPMDALKNLGRSDIPMGEFWYSQHWHEGTNQNTNGKQTAAAAHIYGKRWVMAEGFTSIGPHWSEGPGDLKATADIAFCEGINRFVHHTSTSSRPEDGKPGYEYFAGTHFNPNITWWEQAGAWTDYISRSQWLLSQGLFVADVLYYNGDGAPNLVEPKHVDPALGKGYDYDVCNAEVLLTRLTVKEGRIVLPDGMSYRLLALPDRKSMPVEILAKIKELVEAGATVIGPRPESDPGLRNYPQSDEKIKAMAGELWGPSGGKTLKQRKVGKGHIVWGKSLREVLGERGVRPDFEYVSENKDAFLDFIHRRTDKADIYMVVNRNEHPERVNCSFRIEGKLPELWDPVGGTTLAATVFEQKQGRTIVPLELASHGSIFVVFQKPTSERFSGNMKAPFPKRSIVQKLDNSWQIQFDPEWGPAEPVTFDSLISWTEHDDPLIKYFSGQATYKMTFDLAGGSPKNARLWLDLGQPKNLAAVRLNGKNLGVVWTPPYRVDITDAVLTKGNRLEIDVVNLWPNRLIGDAALPPEKRRTRTNVSIFKKDTPLLPSGLLGPVRVMQVR
jgi:hypothetical protein